jgi:hypothetical protein
MMGERFAHDSRLFLRPCPGFQSERQRGSGPYFLIDPHKRDRGMISSCVLQGMELWLGEKVRKHT